MWIVKYDLANFEDDVGKKSILWIVFSFKVFFNL